MLKILMTLIRFFFISVGRNVLRLGRGHVASHRMREGALVANWNRSDSYRRRYKGGHFYSLRKEINGLSASTTTGIA